MHSIPFNFCQRTEEQMNNTLLYKELVIDNNEMKIYSYIFDVVEESFSYFLTCDYSGIIPYSISKYQQLCYHLWYMLKLT